jgi:FlaA1/EpsC-like NDP-sugar epimerase
MRDVNNGWLIRYTHANVASFFFIFVYALNYKFIISKNLFFCKLPKQIIKLCKLTLSCYFLSLAFSRLLAKDKKALSDNFIKKSRFLDLFLNRNKKPEKKMDNKFIQWFVGFSDAEGTFLIQTKKNSEVHFIFKITLHIEDSAVLFLIKDKLGIGVVSLKGNTCTFSVHSFQLLVEILLPIFDKYPLITHKQLDYRD